MNFSTLYILQAVFEAIQTTRSHVKYACIEKAPNDSYVACSLPPPTPHTHLPLQELALSNWRL